MSPKPLRVEVVVASTREGRFGPVVAGWFLGRAKGRRDMSFEVIDLVEMPLPSVLGPCEALTARRRAQVEAVRTRLGAAEAFVVVTPEYNHSFPASVKNAIDWFTSEWEAKPVGFVSYGGTAGGLRAVEQLRLVFAELHAVAIRDGVSFANVWDRFSEGELEDPAGPERAVEVMLERLAWWARALRSARAECPYRRELRDGTG